MITIRRREIAPANRRIPFCSFARPSLIQVSQNNGQVRDGKGSVVDIGNGHYCYEPTRDEIDFVGALSVMVTPTRLIVVARIEPATDTDDPPVYFEIATPDLARELVADTDILTGANLDRYAWDRGIVRRIDSSETDAQLRARLSNTSGSEESIRAVLEQLPGVTVTAIGYGIIGTVDIACTADTDGMTYAESDQLRDLIDFALYAELPMGIGHSLTLRTRCAVCQALHDRHREPCRFPGPPLAFRDDA